MAKCRGSGFSEDGYVMAHKEKFKRDVFLVKATAESQEVHLGVDMTRP